MNFLLSINYIYWLILSALFFAGGEFLSKEFALNPKWSYVFLIIFVYALGTMAWLPAILSKNSLSVAGTIWSVLSLFATISIGVLIFKEKVSVVSGIGMVTAAVAIVLLSIG
jgi:multidrug transporter EmrE-like cation transporter